MRAKLWNWKTELYEDIKDFGPYCLKGCNTRIEIKYES